MPIRPELRKFYGRDWRLNVRPRILARAGDRCEQCAAPNHTTVLRALDWWTPATLEATVFYMNGRIHGKQIEVLPWRCGKTEMLAHFPRHEGMKWAAIQLGVAHLNHDPSDNRDENLKALCRRCHLVYDLNKHHQTRAARKDAARPLLNVSTKEASL